MAHAEGIVPSTLAAERPVRVGFTEDGTVSFNVHVFVPIFVLPLYVLQVIVQVPDTAFGI